MADLYYLDYQYVIKSLFFKAQKMAILALKVRLTCVVSVVLLRGKTYAFTKKYTTLTNQPVFFWKITAIFLPFKRFQLLDWLILMTWFCNKKSKTAYRVSTRYRQEYIEFMATATREYRIHSGRQQKNFDFIADGHKRILILWRTATRAAPCKRMLQPKREATNFSEESTTCRARPLWPSANNGNNNLMWRTATKEFWFYSGRPQKNFDFMADGHKGRTLQADVTTEKGSNQLQRRINHLQGAALVAVRKQRK